MDLCRFGRCARASLLQGEVRKKRARPQHGSGAQALATCVVYASTGSDWTVNCVAAGARVYGAMCRVGSGSRVDGVRDGADSRDGGVRVQIHVGHAGPQLRET